MLTSLFWVLGGFSGTGLGLYVLAMFVPSVAAVLRAALDFVRSPIGTACAIIVGGFLLASSMWVAGDIHGTNVTRAAWRADNARKKAAAEREIAENRIKAAADADLRIAGLDAYAKTLEKKVADYENQNPARHGMRLTDDDVRRLRQNDFR